MAKVVDILYHIGVTDGWRAVEMGPVAIARATSVGEIVADMAVVYLMLVVPDLNFSLVAPPQPAIHQSAVHFASSQQQT
jgi:hypothetical protein